MFFLRRTACNSMVPGLQNGPAKTGVRPSLGQASVRAAALVVQRQTASLSTLTATMNHTSRSSHLRTFAVEGTTPKSLDSRFRYSTRLAVSKHPSLFSSTIRSFASQTPPGGQQHPPWMHPESNKPGHYLAQHCTDLTVLAAANKLDPVIARHEEIRRCLQILARRTKSNIEQTGPLLGTVLHRFEVGMAGPIFKRNHLSFSQDGWLRSAHSYRLGGSSWLSWQRRFHQQL